MSTKGHVVVVGSGAAGTACARALADAGWRVTQADDDRWGGTCLWRGCIPKKSLYHSALTLRRVREAEQFGIEAGEPTFDWQGVLAWKWHAQESYAGDQEALALARGIEVVKAAAHFVSSESIAVGDEVYSPDHIVVAVGSEPVMPPLPGIELADTSEAVLHYPHTPQSLAIIGGGFIAMEFAGIFATFGTRVSVITRPERVLDQLDADLAAAAVQRLQSLGVTFITGANVRALTGEPGDLHVEIEGADSGVPSPSYERVLVAVGRRPALERLELDAGGIETDDAGHVVLDTHLRSTNSLVWFAGDAAGGMMQTPVASYEGALVARSIDSGASEVADTSRVPITCFTTPQLATVGLTEHEARAQGLSVATTRIELGSTGAGVIADETGFVKLVSESESGRILGCQIAGDSASDLIFSAAIALTAGMTAGQLGDVIAVHPSMAEAVAWSG